MQLLTPDWQSHRFPLIVCGHALDGELFAETDYRSLTFDTSRCIGSKARAVVIYLDI